MRILRYKNILITGGGGFIGQHLARELAREKAKVTIVDIKKPAGLKNVTFVKQDLVKFLSVSQNLRKYDFIYHLAGNSSVPLSREDPEMDFTLNLSLVIKLLESVRNLKKKPIILFASSAAVYGIPQKLPISEKSETCPLNPYGISKLFAEKYFLTYGHYFGLKTIIMRFFNVYGPGQRKLVVYDLIKKLIDDSDRIEVTGDGKQILDLLYIDDLIHGLVILAQKGKKNEIYNLAAGNQISINNLIKTIIRIMDKYPEINFTGKKSVDRWKVDNKKIKLIGFRERIDLRDGLLATYNWIKND